MAGHDTDITFFEWAFGILASFFIAAFGYLHVRIGQETEARRQGARDGSEAMSGTEQKLWEAFEKHRREFQDFRAQMVETAVKRADLRDDLHDMEGRLALAQREMESRIMMMLRIPQGDRAP